MILVSPSETHPTHHISLQTRDGTEIGLILCDDQGGVISDPIKMMNKHPVDTTALKQTSGGSSYNDYVYPYSPIVQDDVTGGRGNLNHEADTTKYYDAFRASAYRSGKAFAGPMEQYAKGHRTVSERMYSTTSGVQFNRIKGDLDVLLTADTPVTGFTAAEVWLLLRRRGRPGDLTITLYDTSAFPYTALDTATVENERMDDILSEWVPISFDSWTAGDHKLVINPSTVDDDNNYWEVASIVGGSHLFRVTPADSERSCLMYQYKEQQYFVLSPVSGAPSLYMAGDRGCCDDNTGTLDRLIDATKSWTTNEWAGQVVKIIDGPGATEETPWRTVVSNTATALIVDTPFLITHTTSSEYVLYGTKVKEITGHGMTVPVTDVLVTKEGMVLFAQGDNVNIRRMKEETTAGAWTITYADDGTNKATYLEYKPQANLIIRANQRDGSGNTSISTAPPVAWATSSHTFATAVNIDSKYIRINGLAIYPDEAGTEAIWVFKEDIIYIVPNTGTPYPINLDEMRTLRSSVNGKNPLHHNVYLLFPLGYGLERWYNGSIDDVGPNLGEGLPDNRKGGIAMMLGKPGRYYMLIDAGASGYSSILSSDGYHELYRAPYGKRMKSIGYQVVPGGSLDRMWVYQGNDLVYIGFSDGNELDDTEYLYTHEFSITLSRMHAGLYDVMKIIKGLRFMAENLYRQAGDPVAQWFELDYRLEDETEWTTIRDKFTDVPQQAFDFTDIYGIAGRRIQFRVRGHTTSPSVSPIMNAIIISAVLRSDVKYRYGPFTVRVMDHETLLNGETDPITAIEKLKVLEDFADSSTDSMLKIRCFSELVHDKYVFTNPPVTRQVLSSRDESNYYQKNVYITTFTLQDA